MGLFGGKDDKYKNGKENTKYVTKHNIASAEELYEYVKDLDFGEIGAPQLAKQVAYYCVCFKPLDRNNQVWIYGKKGKFTIMRSTVIAGGAGGGMGNVAKNVALAGLTNGWSDFSAAFGDAKKVAKWQVLEVARILEEAGI